MKTPLLFLCHRIPYPPNKGDKIRSFHLLHHLSQHFAIHLASFVDDPEDWPWVPEVEKFCETCLFLPLKPWQAKIRSLSGLLTGDALSVPYYASKPMKNWVNRQVAEHGIGHVLVFSSSMAQFVMDPALALERKIIDFVDIDSDKWEQYAKQKPFPLSWLYRREARCLLAYEQRLAQYFDAGLFVSSSEAAMFKKLVPATADKIGFYNNGVNTEYFRTSPDHQNPFPPGIRPVVFTGAMDYWPNIDAVQWFAREVLPRLLAAHPEMRFYIVGSNPAKAVQQLAEQPGVVVTGRVEDVRPYLQYAEGAVAPMRIARGVQNKVLEAMAMSRPVIVTSKGLESINASDRQQVLLADHADEYLDLLQQVLNGDWEGIGARARQYVVDNFVWEKNLPEVVLLLGKSSDVAAEQAVSHG
jgi:sugar transferase (PEP-CTERM/EpsH1 system associated)